MYKIMIVDDEPDIVAGLALSLEKEGYKVLKAFDGNTALKMAQEENPHLILLDINLPDLDGLNVCKALRAREVDTRIVMLSAKGEEIDKIVGLEIGADDYITKPFSLRELLALVRARLRFLNTATGQNVSWFSFDDITIDFDKRLARRAEKELDLTEREFEILQMLIRYRGRVVTREQLLDKIWGSGACVTSRTVDNHILRIRKKVEVDPSSPRHLLSAYGGGYKFVG